MPTECVLIDMNCPLCGSAVVKVTDAGQDDRAICPICWASASLEHALSDASALKRGGKLEPKIKQLVDQARFPRRPAALPDQH